MPPIAPHEHNHDELVYLSNKDVQVLVPIVRRAQQQIDTGANTFDALFSAYDSVFAELGLDTSHDRTVFRFLFRLAQPRGRRVGLSEWFLQLLEEQGIRLEFGDEILYPEEIEHMRADTLADPREAQELYAEETDREGRPSRRASFTSLYDTTKELFRQPAPRATSRSSVSRVESKINSYGGSRLNRNALVDEPQFPNSYSHETHHSRAPQADGNLIAHAKFSPRNLRPEEFHLDAYHQDSRRQLASREEAYTEDRLRRLLHSVLLQWSAKTRSSHAYNATLEQKAIERDVRTLLRESFSAMRELFLQRRHQRETERFFEHLYIRAGKARNLYLLTKAFSHWRAVTAEESARTGAARRHVLRHKYFTAWRDITVINELKAQRQGLKRPFSLLRSRLDQINALEATAIAFHQRYLIKIAFYRWFWAYCNAAVPRHRNSQLQTKLLTVWRQKSQLILQQEQQADQFYAEKRRRNAMTKWATAARIDLGGNHQADSFRKLRLLQPIIRHWQAEAKLAPLAARISNIRDWRIARTNFSTWVMRYRSLKRAEDVDERRVKCNAWTVWNDQLRTRLLQSQINERLVIQALYKWVLQERCVLMSRVHDMAVKRRVFKSALLKFRAKADLMKQQEAILVQKRDKSRLASALDLWKLQVVLQKERQITASDHYAKTLQLEVMQQWQEKQQRVQKHELWAADANFYFTTTGVFKKWNHAVQVAQKKRRQAAYITIRKLVKTNLARKVLNTWRIKLEDTDDLETMRQRHVDTQLRKQISVIFGAWRAVTIRRYEDHQAAVESYETRSMKTALGLWREKRQNYQVKVDQFQHLHAMSVSSSLLRKLSLHAFDIRCREQAADAMEKRNFDRHIRWMFRYWADRARVKRQERIASAPFKDDSSLETPPQDSFLQTRSALIPQYGDETQRAEEWTAFDEGLLEVDIENDGWTSPVAEVPVATSTPVAVPGYLSTPSRRSARAKALANLSTTPVGMPPIRTPFTARLRGEREGSWTPGTGRERRVKRVSFDDDPT